MGCVTSSRTCWQRRARTVTGPRIHEPPDTQCRALSEAANPVTYCLFGQVRASTLPDTIRRGVGVGFTGYQLNADASLNARARQYVPSAGRFTSVDPVAWGPGSNPYSYVGNAPTWLVDPTGMTPQDKLRGSFDFFWDNTVQLVVDWNDQQSAASDQRSVFSSMLNGWKSSIQDWIGGCGDSFDYKQTYGAWFTASLIFGAGEVLAVTKTGSWGVKAGAAVRAEKQIAKVDDTGAIGRSSRGENSIGQHPDAPPVAPGSRASEVGLDTLYTKTRNGTPVWSTVRKRYWRHVADNPALARDILDAAFTARNLELMKKGNAPTRLARTGKLERMELSHEPIPQRNGGLDFAPRWPKDHAAVDPYRKLGR